MREAIRDYVEREEAKEEFKQEALASWTAFKETGRHLTGQEVRSWLKNWGTDKEKEIPQCRFNSCAGFSASKRSGLLI